MLYDVYVYICVNNTLSHMLSQTLLLKIKKSTLTKYVIIDYYQYFNSITHIVK